MIGGRIPLPAEVPVLPLSDDVLAKYGKRLPVEEPPLLELEIDKLGTLALTIKDLGYGNHVRFVREITCDLQLGPEQIAKLEKRLWSWAEAQRMTRITK